MGACASGLNYGVLEWVKRNSLRWLVHIERIKIEEFVKKVYWTEIEFRQK